MKKLLTLAAFLTTLLTSVNFQAKATHCAGSDISWQCIGQDSFFLRLNFYRDCSGINAPVTANLAIAGCSPTNLVLPLINPGGTEVSQLCVSQIGNSTCSLGFLPGMKNYIYETIAVLTPCSVWTFSYWLNARATMNNLTAQTTMYIDAEMDSQYDDCNNSPIFATQHVPYVCINQKVTVNFGVYDPDCDSLYFSMMSARTAAATNNTYNAPYTPLIPIETGFVLNSATGKMSFTPNFPGKYIIVLKCEEFDPITQVYKGYVTKETTIIVENCNNTSPSDTSGYITNFFATGGMQTGPYAMELCEGDFMSFDFCIYDLNAGDSITLSANVQTVLPGATFTYVGGNPACGTITWTATGGQCTNRFNITAKDDGCPVTALQTYDYTVKVMESTNAGPDQTICKGDSAYLEVFGGSQFSWTSIAGEPINVGSNFTCDTCSASWASPDSTTTYVITTNVAGSCANVDTVTVFVYDAVVGSITGQLSVTEFSGETYSVTQTAGYTYNWMVTGGLITTGQGTNSIDVSWANTGSGSVCVIKTHIASSCSSDTVCIQINIAPIGIDDMAGNNQFTIVPNPTTGTFTVQGITSEMQVHDLFGRLVLTTTLPQIDMSNQPKGVYIVKVGEAVRKLVLN